VAFEVLLHLATLASVLIVYWRRVTSVLAGMARGDRPSWRFAGLLVVGSVPAAVVGVAFHDFFERYFHSYLLVGMSFLLTAVVLWSTRWVREQATRDEVRLRNAVIMGVAQAVAIFPGISRSGTTITAALWGRVAPYPAAEFSFLLSVIAIAGSGLLEVAGAGASLGTVGPGHVWAFLGALVSGVLAIRFLVALLRRGVFHRFAPYCLAAGTALGVTTWWPLAQCASASHRGRTTARSELERRARRRGRARVGGNPGRSGEVAQRSHGE
jgi:undecaprenyl-diphosphatase